MNKQSIILADLTVGFHAPLGKDVTLFGPVNALAMQGEMIGLIGRNGIGKSTLLRTITGLQPHLHGKIFFNGTENNRIKLKMLARLISFVSTEPVYAPQLIVRELIAMGRFPHTGWLGRLDHDDKRAIDAAIDLAGVSLLLKKPLFELSDGERQKVMIARALAQDTPMVILDEPTAFLDLPARFEILSILHNLAREKDKTVLFSTHDLSIAADIADKLWIMADNQIHQGAPEDLLISDVFRKLFLNSPAEFDWKTSSFRFRRELIRRIVLSGDPKYMLITKRAMERIGFQTIEGEMCELTVDVQEHNGLPVWRLITSDSVTEFETIYALAAKLKSVRN